MGELDEVLQEFLVESHENLDRLDQEFVQLEQDPDRVDLLASVFRTIHTIKGTCGFLGFAKLQGLTHAGETLLARLRDRQIPLDAERVGGLLSLVDGVRAMLAAVERTGTDGDDDFGWLCDALRGLSLDRPDPYADARPPPDAEPPPAAAPAPAPAEDPAEDAAEDADAADDPAPTPQLATPAPRPAAASPAPKPAASEQSVRVDVDLLETLMNLVGELVLARNQLQQQLSSSADPALTSVFQRVDHITSELQEGMMKTRMQTIGSSWSKLPRLVRDVSSVCGKRVRLEMEGQDTEVDRTLLDAIRDPLTHIVRNAIDHGLEPPDERVQVGKPAEGCVRLRAWHEGGQVNIEVADDGRGIPIERVRRKAVERGWVSEEEAAELTERQVTDLVFLPGFSTAEKVTSVSGRGVGMDVVRTDIGAVGGTIDVSTRQGAGTTLRIRIPLTLAIIPALIVHAGGQRFAIPQINVVQMVRLDAQENGAEHVHEARVLRHRGDLLPLLLLDEELELAPAGAGPRNSEVVVLQAGDRRFAAAVDRIGDTAEIVVKPLARSLKAIGAYAGATITGDGGVALIIDIAGLARRAQLAVEGHEHATSTAARALTDGELHRLLVVRTVDDGRAAITLSGVNRLEELPCSLVERIGAREVVPYRGTILPLGRLSGLLQEKRARRRVPSEPSDVLQIVVHQGRAGPVGIVVERICDIVDVGLAERRPPTRAGVRYTAIIDGRVTEILDMDWLVARVDPVVEAHP